MAARTLTNRSSLPLTAPTAATSRPTTAPEQAPARTVSDGRHPEGMGAVAAAGSVPGAELLGLTRGGRRSWLGRGAVRALAAAGMLRGAALASALVVAAAASVSCTPSLIPNTDVEDTELNRGVIEFCEKYRRAVERRDVALLLQLAHADYFEDSGTVDTSDDIDYAGLREYLQTRYRASLGIRYEIRYRRVSEGRGGRINVDYTYTASYRITTEDDQEIWKRAVADNRIVLVPHEETYKILEGM